MEAINSSKLKANQLYLGITDEPHGIFIFKIKGVLETRATNYFQVQKMNLIGTEEVGDSFVVSGTAINLVFVGIEKLVHKEGGVMM
jgi:hypothetical protein